MRKFIIVFLSAVIFYGCSSSSSTNNTRFGGEYEAQGTWTLYNIKGTNVDSTDYTNGLPWVSIMVNALAFNGSTGCNTMSGSVNVSSEKITFSRIITTRMACDKGDEAGFLSVLNNADSFEAGNNMLYLKSGSIVLAAFKKTGEVIKNEGGIKKPGDN
jgi:heat shock protein HslJ